MTPKSVIDFWFDEADRPFWFDKSGEFDQTIRSRFAGLWQQAARAELYEWRATLEGRLAEIIVLDQFSRNLFRNSPQAFACDAMAQVLAQEAAKRPGFAELPGTWRHMMLDAAHAQRKPKNPRPCAGTLHPASRPRLDTRRAAQGRY